MIKLVSSRLLLTQMRHGLSDTVTEAHLVEDTVILLIWLQLWLLPTPILQTKIFVSCHRVYEEIQ